MSYPQREREKEKERSVNNRKWLLFVFNSPYNHEGRQTRKRETPTESEEYCRRGSGAGKLNKSGVHVQLLALHQKHTHTNPHRLTGLVRLH